MSFITDLMARGVSRTGAVQVLLGQPLTRTTDRQVLSRLAIPAARESLSQVAPLSSLTSRVDRRVTLLVSAAGGAPVPTAPSVPIIPTQTSTPTPTAPLDPRQAQINGLKTNIRNVELEIQNLTQQLLNLITPPPGMPLAAWQVQVETLRALLRKMRSFLASLMRQLDDVMGTSFGSSTGSSLGSGAANQAEFESLKDDDGTDNAESSGRSFA